MLIATKFSPAWAKSKQRPPIFVAESGNDDVEGNSINITLPSGRDDNSVTLIVGLARWSGSVTGTLTVGSGTQLAQINNGTNFLSMRVAWLRGSAGSTVTVSGTGTAFQVGGFCLHYSGCVTTGTPYEGADTAFGSASTTHTSPATTTGDINRLGVRIWGRGGRESSTVGSGWTEDFDVSQFASSNLFSGAAYSKAIPVASTEAAASATASDSTTWCCQGLALIPW